MDQETAKISHHQNEPLNPSNIDKIDLQNIFPEEIWFRVLCNAKDPDTYLQVLGASPYFATLIQPFRNHVLFPLVAKILSNRLQQNPEILYKSRQICASWQNAVDPILQTSSPYNLRFDTEKRFSIYEKQNFTEVIDMVEHLREFEEHFNETHLHNNRRNPLILRNVWIRIWRLEDTARHLEFMSEFLPWLDKYGKHIWFLFLEVQIPDGVNLLEFVCNGSINRIFANVPNLRVLVLHWPNAKLVDDSVIDAYFQQNSLPEMRYLTIVSFVHAQMPLAASILQKSPNIEQVRCHISDKAVKCFGEMSTLFARVNSTETLRLLNTIDVNWRLTKLQIYLGKPKIPWSDLFQALGRQFGDTLQELNLRMNVSKTMQFENNLALPKLKYLHLYLQNLVPLDFLLPTSNSLEQLSILVDKDCFINMREWCSCNEETVQFFRFRTEPQKSNIWEIFSELLNVECKLEMHLRQYEISTCTREEWKCYRSLHMSSITNV